MLRNLICVVFFGWPLVGQNAELLAWTQVRVLPHDPAAYTQGLVKDGGIFYESTGLYGRSDLRRVEIPSGRILERRQLEDHYFGEGLAMVGQQLIQLTWQEQTALIYDKLLLAPTRTLPYPGEGWGLAYDSEKLIMSDGSARLTFRDPADFRILGTVIVCQDLRPQAWLNELEFAQGVLWANIYGQDTIARIDIPSGNITGILDLSSLRKLLPRTHQRKPEVLNGIAADETTGHLYITGKFWPSLFEIAVQ